MNGWSLINMGAPGSGKTHALLTLESLHEQLGCPPLELGVISLDRNTRPILGNWEANPKPGKGVCKIRTILPRDEKAKTRGFDDLISLMKAANSLNNEAIQKASFSRSDCTQLIDVVGNLKNFVADDGTNWGDITTWGTRRILCFDGLSGLSRAAKQLAVGMKPALTHPEYQVIMNTLSELLKTVLYDVKCHVVLLAHLAREKDEVSGAERIYPDVIGRKLGPVIGQDFSDIVMQKFSAGSWYWTTNDYQAELKATHLPVAEKMPADFKHMFLTPKTGWYARGGKVE